MNIASFTNVASFDIDAQKTFTPLCPDELPVPEGDQIATELNTQAHYARLRMGSKDAHNPQALWVANEKHPAFSALESELMDTYWPAHAIVGSQGFELIDGLPAVTEYDFFIWKGIELNLHPYGACYHDLAETKTTGVIEYLKQQNIDTVIAGGLATDYCVKTTVLQLIHAGFNVVVNLAACRGIHSKTTASATDEMKAAGAVVLENSAAIKGYLDDH